MRTTVAEVVVLVVAVVVTMIMIIFSDTCHHSMVCSWVVNGGCGHQI